jgi:hypothetical protein
VHPDFNGSQLRIVIRWVPVKKLTSSAEVLWFHLDQKMSGDSVFAIASFKDRNAVQLQLRAQRNF